MKKYAELCWGQKKNELAAMLMVLGRLKKEAQAENCLAERGAAFIESLIKCVQSQTTRNFQTTAILHNGHKPCCYFDPFAK